MEAVDRQEYERVERWSTMLLAQHSPQALVKMVKEVMHRKEEQGTMPADDFMFVMDDPWFRRPPPEIPADVLAQLGVDIGGSGGIATPADALSPDQAFSDPIMPIRPISAFRQR